MAGQQRVDGVLVQAVPSISLLVGRCGPSIGAGSTTQVSVAPRTGALHVGLPGTRAPATAWPLSLPVLFHLYPSTSHILTNRQRSPRSVFPCSVAFRGVAGSQVQDDPVSAELRNTVPRAGRSASSSRACWPHQLSVGARYVSISVRSPPASLSRRGAISCDGLLIGKHRLVP